jgi:hypothetical protein
MRKLQDLAKIVSVEINDTLKEINREQDARGNWRTLVRVVVSFDVDETLTEEQKAKYAKLSDAQKAFLQRTKRQFNVSNLFNGSDILPTPFDTPEGGFDDATQDALVVRVKEFFASIGNVSLFTCHTFAINELSDYSVVYDAETDTAIRERSYLSSGFADDDERIKNILASQLANQIENGDVVTEKSKTDTIAPETTPENTEQKPKSNVPF